MVPRDHGKGLKIDASFRYRMNVETTKWVFDFRAQTCVYLLLVSNLREVGEPKPRS